MLTYSLSIAVTKSVLVFSRMNNNLENDASQPVFGCNASSKKNNMKHI